MSKKPVKPPPLSTYKDDIEKAKQDPRIILAVLVTIAGSYIVNPATDEARRKHLAHDGYTPLPLAQQPADDYVYCNRLATGHVYMVRNAEGITGSVNVCRMLFFITYTADFQPGMAPR